MKILVKKRKKKKKEKEKTRKYRIALRRIFAKAELFFVLTFFMIFCAWLAYYIMAYSVWCIETGRAEKFFDIWKVWKHWKCMELLYKSIDSQTRGYVPTIIGASASLLITMTTIIQSHLNRAQDRVMNFPKNCIDEISIGLDVKSNVEAVKKYFDPVRAETVIELSFKEGFSTYYEAVPFRFFVYLSKKGNEKIDKKWEELPIYNYQYSNLLDDNPNDFEILIETGSSNLLDSYCHKSPGNDDYRLKIVLDIQWKNNLLPKWRRAPGDMYIREEIKVARVQENKKNSHMVLPYKYDVLYTEHRKAYLASWILLIKSMKTSKRLEKELQMAGVNGEKLRGRQRGQ